MLYHGCRKAKYMTFWYDESDVCGIFLPYCQYFSSGRLFVSLPVVLKKQRTEHGDKMLITMVIATIVALLFGKVTIKEIKEYVRKHTKESGSSESGGNHTGDSDAGSAA